MLLKDECSLCGIEYLDSCSRGGGDFDADLWLECFSDSSMWFCGRISVSQVFRSVEWFGASGIYVLV